MTSSIRMYGGGKYWFVTARCFQARKLMTPEDPLIREVCGGVLARAAAKYEVGVLAYVFLSNHLHLVIRANGRQVALFLKYLMGNLSRKLAPLCKEPWSGCFWEGRRSVIAILDDHALLERIRYVAAHGVKEGLVARAEDWEGLHFASHFIDGAPRRFLWFNWTRRWKKLGARAATATPEAERYGDQWADAETLRLEIPPPWAGLSEQQRRKAARELVDHAADQTKSDDPLGMAEVKQKGTEIPAWRKKGREPLCHASDAGVREAFCEQRLSFLDAFRAAATEWLSGNLAALFPEECFRPFLHNEVQIV